MKKKNITFIEGIWGAGKTTYALSESLRSKCLYIEEPSHVLQMFSNRSEITAWYLDAHYKDLEKATSIAITGSHVLIERSPLSAIVFKRIYINSQEFEDDMNNFRLVLKNISKKDLNITMRVLLCADIKEAVKNMKLNHHLSDLSEEKLVRDFQDLFVQCANNLAQDRYFQLEFITT